LNIIIGTAGHVDHGKTELIKALTGRNTDRLEEEKKRGISIVLGFAPMSLKEGLNVGVVDVPGHERFVKTMVAGAVGVDLALLVVAADEGVMPQTEEHMEVLRLLGVETGVVAVTKVDLVDEDTDDFVEEEVREFVKGTFLEDAEVIRTSVVTHEGIEELREALTRAALTIKRVRVDDFFRMPVDRIFTLQGIGTIVTGTTWSGEVKKGDELVVEPLGRRVRIRDVQSFDRTLDRATSGLRTALAVHGVKKEELEIGFQLVTPGVLKSSGIINVSIEASPVKGGGVRTRQRVRFHHAAREVLGRIYVIGSGAVRPGEKGYAQVRLEEPVIARRGDRFVIRTYSPMRVVAGGTILDPTASKVREKHFPEVLEQMHILHEGNNEEVVELLIERRGVGGLEERELLRFGLSMDEVRDTLKDLEEGKRVIKSGNLLFSLKVVEKKRRELLEQVKTFMRNNALAWGMDREELKSALGLVDSPLFDILIERGIEAGEVFVKGSMIRVGTKDMILSQDDSEKLKAVEEKIRSKGFEFVRIEELEGHAGDRNALVNSIRLLEERGRIRRITAGAYMHADLYREVITSVRDVMIAEGSVSVGKFKEMFGVSRKFAVPLLEHLDTVGFTRREGNERVPGPRMDEMLGNFSKEED